MPTGCLPTGFSIPGSVLHTGLAELRAALPGGALARVCTAGRLEGWAGVAEYKDGIIHTQFHWLSDKQSSECHAHSLFRYLHRELVPDTCFTLPSALVECFLAFSELQNEKEKNTWQLHLSWAILQHHLMQVRLSRWRITGSKRWLMSITVSDSTNSMKSHTSRAHCVLTRHCL